MKIYTLFRFIPYTALGQIIGGLIAVPLLYWIINLLFFSNKYNDATELNADAYIKRSVVKEITMPAYESGKYVGKHLVGHLSYALNAQSDGLSNTLVLMIGKTRGFLYVLIRMKWKVYYMERKITLYLFCK